MPYTINLDSVAVTDAGQTLTFANERGTVLIVNSGTVNPCFFAVGGAAPVATFGTGRKQIPVGGSINLTNVSIRQLSFRCAAGLTTDVEIISQQVKGEGGIL